MYTTINIAIIFIFIFLLILSIISLLNNHICDYQNCKSFIDAFQHNSTKKRLLMILDNLCEDGLLPFSFITSLIICGLFFCILPIILNVKLFLLVFLLSFLTFYLVFAFFINHYVIPIKKYIREYIEKNISD